ENYLRCIHAYDSKNVAMFGVNFLSNEIIQECAAIPSLKLITSGSILNLKASSKIGAFDEDLFIDLVDLEYCYRASLKGYSTIAFANIPMEHSLGKTESVRSIKTARKSNRILHSPIRLYY